MTSLAEAEALAQVLREHLGPRETVTVGAKPYNISTSYKLDTYDDYIGDTMTGIVAGFRAGWAARKRFAEGKVKQREVR